MRVALFIDGKNLYAGCKAAAPARQIDFSRMADWLVDQVGGSFLWGAYYYTGVETGNAANSEGQQGLSRFLDMIELQKGFFVKRFPRKARISRCMQCGEQTRYSQEKEVDTTMVADMLRLAAVGAFDILVLLSGDADLAPAVEGVRSLGKQAFVATWGGGSLSGRLRRAAFDHVDLCAGADFFSATTGPPPKVLGSAAVDCEAEADLAATGKEPGDAPAATSECGEDAFLRELGRAEVKFANGYVGVNYFLAGWKAAGLSGALHIRRRILDRLIQLGRVELYEAPNGDMALRTSQPE